MATNVGSATGYLDLDISGFLAGLRSANDEANKQTKNMATKIGENLSGAGKSLTTAGTALTTKVTVPILGAGAAIVKLSADFESAMSKVSAISGATGDDLQALNEKAQEMGAKTKFSATEAAEAFTYMAMAGWKTEAMLEGIDGIMNLAAADGLDLATTSDIVTDALTAFGLSAGDSAHFADVLAKASSSANTNVAMLGESFKYVAPVAGALGYSVEDTATALGLMANAGIKGSQAGTALRSAISRMVNPVEKAGEVMEKYNLSLTNTDGSMKSLGDVMVELRANMGSLSEAEQAQAAAALFGQEAMSGMLAIINASDEDFAKLTEQIYNADGAAEQMANTMLDNLSGQFTILKSSLEGLALQFGEILLPYVKQFTEWVQNLTLKLQQLTPEQKEQVVRWAAIIAAIGPVLLITGKLVSAAGKVFTSFGKLKAGFTAVKAGGAAGAGALSKLGGVLAGITGPIAAVIAIVAVLVAAFVNLWKNNEEFRNKVIAIWGQIKEIFDDFAQGIVDRLNELGFDFENITEVIKAVWQGFCDFLVPVFEGAFQLVANALKLILNVILGLFDYWVAIFQGDWQGAWDAVKGIFVSVWEFIKSTFENVLNVMKGILDTVCKWFGTTWENTWSNIKMFFSNAWNNIKSTVSSAVNSVKTTISNGLNIAKTTVSNIFDDIKNAVSDKINAAKDTVSDVIDKIKDLFDFEWSLPALKLPHITITGEWGFNPPRVPSFSISWYKKAMLGGMIMNSPTIFGYDPSTGKFLGGGEAGSETLVGTSNLMKMIRSAVNDAVRPMVEATYQLTRVSHELGYITNNAFTRQTQVFEQIMKGGTGGTGNGDTFNFYSPKAIDEIEAAKQMKIAKRDLAEGF